MTLCGLGKFSFLDIATCSKDLCLPNLILWFYDDVNWVGLTVGPTCNGPKEVTGIIKKMVLVNKFAACEIFFQKSIRYLGMHLENVSPAM
jgi:hypothetical protein